MAERDPRTHTRLHEELARIEAERLRLRRLLGLPVEESPARPGDRGAMAMIQHDFLSLVSHELRTPVQVMAGLCRILLRGRSEPLSAGQAEYVGRMADVADTLGRLVEDILDLGCVRAGTFAIAPAPMAPAPLLEETVASMEPLAVAKRQHLGLEVEDDLPTLEADARRIGQVIVNLLSNAIKFTPEGGTITLACRHEGDFLRIEVRDTGVGIAPDQLERLFLPFSRLDCDATRTEWGAGLGLSICKAIVVAHGGAIGANSRPGAGSTFWFTLPVPPGAKVATAADSGQDGV